MCVCVCVCVCGEMIYIYSGHTLFMELKNLRVLLFDTKGTKMDLDPLR